MERCFKVTHSRELMNAMESHKHIQVRYILEDFLDRADNSIPETITSDKQIYESIDQYAKVLDIYSEFMGMLEQALDKQELIVNERANSPV